MSWNFLKNFCFSNHAKWQSFLSVRRKYEFLYKIEYKPKASEVLTAYLKQTREPVWTSFFVKWNSITNDQFGMSCFNWHVGQSNYAVLRVGCFPYIKYHCTKGPVKNFKAEDLFYRFIKILNLGIPSLLYGIAAFFFISHKELVYVKGKQIQVYFLLKEQSNCKY